MSDDGKAIEPAGSSAVSAEAALSAELVQRFLSALQSANGGREGGEAFLHSFIAAAENPSHVRQTRFVSLGEGLTQVHTPSVVARQRSACGD